MLDLLWLVPTLPFAGFLVLALLGRRLPDRAAALVGVGSVGLAALVATLVGVAFVRTPPAGGAWTQHLWTWWDVGGMSPGISLYLDPLALVFILVITWVGFLIHLYSMEYMAGDEAFGRFFAYMNLFVGAMLTLVLADNLMLLYLGWEGVGLCSYLLIGFWYKDPYNGYAARKAFVVTRVGDTAMAVGLFLLFWNLGTLHVQDLLGHAQAQWVAGSSLATLVALLLLGGAVGKSAQLPLQTWLPDAMAGPTPVSALIHAATMVTAGVYLIARTHVLFTLAPAAMLVVAIVGALTLLLAGVSALVQSDIKRVLAYSTISQIGYMFLALGVGAFSAAILHFMTHAFFKALLFLGAGAVILALHHEQDIFKMGGLRRTLPGTFWTFLIGSCSLAALPLVTAGFYSKDLILWEVWSSPHGSRWLWAAGLLGALLTGIYTFRLVFIVFFGAEKTPVTRKPGAPVMVALVILAVLSVIGGFVEIPPTLGHLPVFSDFMKGTFAAAGDAHDAFADKLHALAPEGLHTAAAHNGPHEAVSHAGELNLQILAAIVSLAGVLVAYLLFRGSRAAVTRWSASALGSALCAYWKSGWGYDWLYDRLIVWPYCWIARINRPDYIDSFYSGLAYLTAALHAGLKRTQPGTLRTYATGIVAGAIIALAILVVLR
jgi:NADH-quinone oxidoreductase subunit L